MTTFRINRVYTRSGDAGDTGLVGGERVRKTSLRVLSYGEVDELNAAMGCLKEVLPEKLNQLLPLIESLQQELFDIGSELATPGGAEYPGMWRVADEHVKKLEELCDRWGQGLAELKSFILPGGSLTAAWFHLARTICRRAERSVISLYDEFPAQTSITLIKYLNRLSDLLFILARCALKEEGRDAPLWVPEKDRVK